MCPFIRIRICIDRACVCTHGLGSTSSLSSQMNVETTPLHKPKTGLLKGRLPTDARSTFVYTRGIRTHRPPVPNALRACIGRADGRSPSPAIQHMVAGWSSRIALAMVFQLASRSYHISSVFGVWTGAAKTTRDTLNAKPSGQGTQRPRGLLGPPPVASQQVFSFHAISILRGT